MMHLGGGRGKVGGWVGVRMFSAILKKGAQTVRVMTAWSYKNIHKRMLCVYM